MYLCIHDIHRTMFSLSKSHMVQKWSFESYFSTTNISQDKEQKISCDKDELTEGQDKILIIRFPFYSQHLQWYIQHHNTVTNVCTVTTCSNDNRQIKKTLCTSTNLCQIKACNRQHYFWQCNVDNRLWTFMNLVITDLQIWVL